MITQKYLHNALERTDKLKKRVKLSVGHSKDFSKHIIKLVRIVPPSELKASIKKLLNDIKQELDKMESKRKNLKRNKKKKAVKKTIEQRLACLSF